MINNNIINPQLDLVIERVVDVPVELVWKAWTQAEHLKEWFVPQPWSIPSCEIDLRPGGYFRTTMRSPEGEEHKNDGCYLEVIPKERLIWTSALLPGYRPAPKPTNGPNLLFTAMIQFESSGKGTKFTTIVMHADEDIKNRHEEMGFYEGWGTCYDQLGEYVKHIK